MSRWFKRLLGVRESRRGLRAFDFNLPVFAYQRRENGSLETPKPVIYGTAFPIAPGLFATAGHVVRDADADGRVGLSYFTGAGEPVVHHHVPACEYIREIDLGLMQCPSLAHLAPIALEFDRQLDMLHPAMAMGFPMALDVEFVSCVPRGFEGSVVTRRQLYHLPAQPPGYELSFFAPQGLSGAPLMSMVHGTPRCYGYVVQQSTIGLGPEKTPVGLAVSIEVLLTVKTSFAADGYLASVFGKHHVLPRRPAQKKLPGGMRQTPAEDLEHGWPDDDLPEEGDKSQ